MEEARDRLELKQQELEDCRTIMRRSEAEKARLEAKVIQPYISNSPVLLLLGCESYSISCLLLVGACYLVSCMVGAKECYIRDQCWGSGSGICMFLGLPDPDPLVRGMDPDLAPDASLFS